MLIFMDGFDHYATADINKKWSAVGSSVMIVSNGGRRGGGCLRNLGVGPSVVKNFTPGTSFVIGAAFKASAFPTVPIFTLVDAGTVQCSLLINTDGTLSVVRSTGTAVTNGRSASAITLGTYYYIEWKVTISNSIEADSCRVVVNGTQEFINVTAGQDLQATANNTANQLRVSTTAAMSTTTHEFDDFYLCDQSGGENDDFLGDCRIDTEFANGDGFYQQGTPTPSGTHYTCVDEATPNTTDYVDLAAAGDRDIYDFGDLQHLASQIVYGVQVNPCVSKDDAGARSVGVTARSGTTDADKGDHGLSTTPAYYTDIFETDPATGVAWTESGVNAAQFGPKCTL